MARWFVLIGGLGVSVGLALGDWPQFLGPDRNGIAGEAKELPRSWPAGGPKVLWKIPVGIGFAGPAIYGDSVLLLDREDDARDVLRRLRLADGREVWRYAYRAPGRLDRNGSRTTPATDGKLVFAIGPFGHIHAVRFADKELVWKHHLLGDWGGGRPSWGVAQSPLLLDKMVIVAPWGRKAAVVALDKATGKEVWRTPNPRGIAPDYSSPVLMNLGGRRMVVASGKKGYTIGVDARTGEQLWTYSGYSCNIHIPSPTVLRDGRVFLTGGYRAGAAMFQVERGSRKFRTKQLWKNNSLGSQIAQGLFYKGYIYGNSNNTGGGLTCISLGGQVKWQTRNRPGFDIGNLLIADGLIFIVNGRNGQLFMAEASPGGYKELGRAAILKGSNVWAPMAYSDGKLVLRDQTTLACIDLKASAR